MQNQFILKMQKILSIEFPNFRQYRVSVISEMEQEYCQKLMKKTRGNIKYACTVSGLGRSRLYSLLKKHNVSRYGWDM